MADTIPTAAAFLSPIPATTPWHILTRQMGRMTAGVRRRPGMTSGSGYQATFVFDRGIYHIQGERRANTPTICCVGQIST
jgi:hypothetical protein